MTKIRKPNEYGKLRPSKLENFEKTLGTPLPSEYRDFLLTNNGGEPDPADFKVSNGYSDIHGPFHGLHEGPDYARLQEIFDDYRGRIPEGFLPIAGDSSGNKICLGLAGKSKGAVFFWDHEQEGVRGYKPELLAPSFPKFLAGLEEWVSPLDNEIEIMIEKNNVKGIKKLLDGGFDVETKVSLDMTMLEVSAIHNKVHLIELLHGHGAKLKRALKFAKDNLEFSSAHKQSVSLLTKLYKKG